jgi:hypothetical protein
VPLAFGPAWPALRDRVGRGGWPSQFDAMREAQAAEDGRMERLGELLAEKRDPARSSAAEDG